MNCTGCPLFNRAEVKCKADLLFVEKCNSDLNSYGEFMGINSDKCKDAIERNRGVAE